ncbi:MAG TPA: fibronectin type III domain-containing protein [Candidatus Kapabacteria bacterium]|nr:fibronectin type III domain-containing protein [Candidatus Kapabacteria bacterium]
MSGFYLSKGLGKFILLLAACASLAGCLVDNSQIVQVVPRLVLAPQNPRFQAINFVAPASGSMLVKWNRSIADTQLNFKGYYVKLWQYYVDPLNGNLDSIINPSNPPLATAQIGRTTRPVADTSCIFTQTTLGPELPEGTYLVSILGVKANDSGTQSLDSSQYSGLFDPRPLTDPTNLRATSLGPNQIGLRWTASPTDTNAGFFRYVIYYRDTTKNDTGHVLATNQKQPIIIDSNGAIIGWNDSTAIVGVPGFTPQNATTSEWPYQFWVKSERNDSTFVYTDTNSETWAGAAYLPSPGVDSGGGWGGIHNSIFIGSFNQNWAIVDDSNRTADMQVKVTIDISNRTVMLTAENNTAFLLDNSTGTARMDTAYSLGSIYYKYPYVADFTVTSVTLPQFATSTGIVLYLMIPDPLLGNKPEWARLFIKSFGGTFINSTSGIHCDASFQPATSFDGGTHLPYY